MKEEKKNSKVGLIIGLAALTAIIYFVYKFTSLPKLITDKLNPKYNNGGDLIVDYGDEVNTDKVMTLGDKGNNVTRLQTEVNKYITDLSLTTQKISVDGEYGPETEAAIKSISNNTLHSGNVTVNKIANLSHSAFNPLPTLPLANNAPYIAPKQMVNARINYLDSYSN